MLARKRVENFNKRLPKDGHKFDHETEKGIMDVDGSDVESFQSASEVYSTFNFVLISFMGYLVYWNASWSEK